MELMENKYWQTSMGYTCHGCGAVFLIGWRVILTNKTICDTCKEHTHQEVKELIY